MLQTVSLKFRQEDEGEMVRFSIAVLPGDGIGPEVVEQAVRILKVATQLSRQTELVLDRFPDALKHVRSLMLFFLQLTRPWPLLQR